MKRLMKAELYKFGHEKSVWIISLLKTSLFQMNTLI